MAKPSLATYLAHAVALAQRSDAHLAEGAQQPRPKAEAYVRQHRRRASVSMSKRPDMKVI
jgi:hypothetical protein